MSRLRNIRPHCARSRNPSSIMLPSAQRWPSHGRSLGPAPFSRRAARRPLTETSGLQIVFVHNLLDCPQARIRDWKVHIGAPGWLYFGLHAPALDTCTLSSHASATLNGSSCPQAAAETTSRL